MKAIHLTAYGNPAKNLQMVDVPEPDAPSTGEAWYAWSTRPWTTATFYWRMERTC